MISKDGSSLEAIDTAARAQSYRMMNKEIQLLDDLLVHINHGHIKLREKQHDRGLNFLVSILLTRAFNSLWRGREDAVLGYYAESLTLCRSAFEHWITAKWVVSHPEATDRWLWAIVEEVEQPSVYIPKLDLMMVEVDPSKFLKDTYEVLSKFAHPRGIGLRWVVHFDETSTYLRFGGHFDHFALRSCLFFLVMYAQSCLLPTGELVERMLGSIDRSWLERAQELSVQASAFVDTVTTEVMKVAAERDVAVADEGA